MYNRKLFIIGAGPAASGKSFLAKQLIPKILHAEGLKDEQEVLYLDGGITRECSNIWNLVNRNSIALGYKGASNLYAKAKKAHRIVKNDLEQYATTYKHHIFKPETFATDINPRPDKHNAKRKEINAFAKNFDRKLVGIYFETPEKVIAAQGKSRAFANTDLIQQEKDKALHNKSAYVYPDSHTSNALNQIQGKSPPSNGSYKIGREKSLQFCKRLSKYILVKNQASLDKQGNVIYGQAIIEEELAKGTKKMQNYYYKIRRQLAYKFKIY